MIVTSDCDQFNTVMGFGGCWLLKNAILFEKHKFIPRELFNMIWLQFLYLNPYCFESIASVNLVPVTIRKNLTNINRTFMVKNTSLKYFDIITNYIKGDIFISQ